MSNRKRLFAYALLVGVTFAIVVLASALDSALPLFFAWLPAAVIMRMESRSDPARPGR
ncbi:MAG: hypothetical protein WD004_07810 [Actinomycetota bacterium]